jgi:hypothetical protein
LWFLFRSHSLRFAHYYNNLIYLNTSSFTNPNAEIPGLKDMVTTTGLHIETDPTDSEAFIIIETGTVIRKV